MEDTTALRARLWARTEVDSETGCWNWTGQLDSGGYGKINAQHRTFAVHRLGCTLVGAPFDPELTLDHLCRNRRCWNPAHLEPCTLRLNILRGVGPTAENAHKTECIHGHPFDEENTRWRYRPGRNPERECRECRREHKRRSRRAA